MGDAGEGDVTPGEQANGQSGIDEGETSSSKHYAQGNVECTCIDAMVAAFGKEAVDSYCRINAFLNTYGECMTRIV